MGPPSRLPVLLRGLGRGEQRRKRAEKDPGACRIWGEASSCVALCGGLDALLEWYGAGWLFPGCGGCQTSNSAFKWTRCEMGRQADRQRDWLAGWKGWLADRTGPTVDEKKI